MTLYEATSLHPEPHAAYKALAITAGLRGQWKAAQSHYKNCGPFPLHERPRFILCVRNAS